MRKSESGLPVNRMRGPTPVAQVFNLLYRRFPIGRPQELPSREHSQSQPRWRCFSLAPSEGERVGVRGPFSRLGSWSQCMRKHETRDATPADFQIGRPPGPTARLIPAQGGVSAALGSDPKKNTAALKARLIKNCDPQQPTWNNARHELEQSKT